MPGAALELQGLRKAFGDTGAVAGADLSVSRGAFLGLVGPNGAGKTTLLEVALSGDALLASPAAAR